MKLSKLGTEILYRVYSSEKVHCTINNEVHRAGETHRYDNNVYTILDVKDFTEIFTVDPRVDLSDIPDTTMFKINKPTGSGKDYMWVFLDTVVLQ
ncbi:hypothetical protein VPT02_088 [Vibrio phage VPT02]|nr:hypothetical protein VPT02_088 [Vibrio phage VPT02]